MVTTGKRIPFVVARSAEETKELSLRTNQAGPQPELPSAAKAVDEKNNATKPIHLKNFILKPPVSSKCILNHKFGQEDLNLFGPAQGPIHRLGPPLSQALQSYLKNEKLKNSYVTHLTSFHLHGPSPT